MEHRLRPENLYTSVAVRPAPCPDPYLTVACPEFHVVCRLGRELFTLPTYIIFIRRYHIVDLGQYGNT